MAEAAYWIVMEALIGSTLAVAIAEIGDKTQLLSLILAARFHQRLPIVLGILVATLINHGASAWFGTWLTDVIPETLGRWLIGGSFILVALWVLVPDKTGETPEGPSKYGPFLTALVLFFVAEIGDKTQVATIILAAQYETLVWVTLGTTLGMLAANVPVIYAGKWLIERIPLHYARWTACAVFTLMGMAMMFGVF
jgi:putative Ca2+/H+ antiporter (TMEM165/GDT1 family)